ncbi:hypothetical protein V8C35DRAFT_318499 [Trichoderma chlorosporum]
MIGDHRWPYAGLLPYMKLIEATPLDNPSEHGADGLIHIQSITSTHRELFLRSKTLQSWQEIGVNPHPNNDGKTGNTLGIGNLFENKNQGRREMASNVFSPKGITALTETLVSKVLFQHLCSQ